MTDGQTSGRGALAQKSGQHGNSWAPVFPLILGVLALAGVLWITLQSIHIEFERSAPVDGALFQGSLVIAGIVALICTLSLRHKEGRTYVIAGLVCALLGVGITLSTSRLGAPYNPLRPHPIRDFAIDCAGKTGPTAAPARITTIGGHNADGTIWRLAAEEAIRGIEAGTWRLFVPAKGSAGGVIVIVARGPAGERYLKAAGDSQQPESLLFLQECAGGRK